MAVVSGMEKSHAFWGPKRVQHGGRVMNAIVSRRAVLVGGVTAGSLLAGAAVFTFASRPAAGAAVLSEIELAVVEQAARVLFPAGIFPVAGGDGQTGPAVDALLAEVIDPPAVAPFRSMLAALEWERWCLGERASLSLLRMRRLMSSTFGLLRIRRHVASPSTPYRRS